MTAARARDADVIVVGASLSAAAAAKRLTDAGLETVVLERKRLPRHKVCSGILAPRGHRFLIENFGPLPREVLHEPTACRGVTFHFPTAPSLSMDFDGGPTAHLHRRYSDYLGDQAQRRRGPRRDHGHEPDRRRRGGDAWRPSVTARRSATAPAT